eukprot:91105-Amphidinium_carterae.2
MKGVVHWQVSASMPTHERTCCPECVEDQDHSVELALKQARPQVPEGSCVNGPMSWMFTECSTLHKPSYSQADGWQQRSAMCIGSYIPACQYTWTEVQRLIVR